MDTCPKCDGYGEMSGCDECNDTGKILNEQKTKIGSLSFNSYLIKLVKDAFPECKIYLNGNKPAKLIFNGGEGLIMPMFDHQ